ncbi:hypothetical protein [Brevibacillus sp. SYSU BS000544]|uniref:hypothetical protein n=1 Tax=Brevibacillus sp. SYSU BS000544 TaxID=3416443 RepID=UPI003CE52B4C
MVFAKVASLLLCASLLFSPYVENMVGHHQSEENSTITPLATISDEDAYSFTFSTREDRIKQEIGFQIINALSLKPVEFRAVVKLKDTELSIGLQNLSNYTKDEFISRWKDALKEAVVAHNETEGMESITLDGVTQGYYFTMIRFEGTGSSLKNDMEKILRFEKMLRETVADLKVSVGGKNVLKDTLP